METDSVHWADKAAERVLNEWGNLKEYVCASGITPSGHVHIGNFREIITTYLVLKALEDKGKKTKFIYSWDDYDRFRKVPKNIVNQKEYENYIGMSVSDVPDPCGKHNSYAEHYEKELEESIKGVGFDISFIYQHKKYKNCDYDEDIRVALRNRKKIADILDKYREEPLEKDWIPLNVYCHKCKKDVVTVTKYDEEYTIDYKCECGHTGKVDFRKDGNINLPWRVDWPMRWNYEKVNFEPGGKDHSTLGGSYTTAKDIVKVVWGRNPPTYQMYDFIKIKGKDGKMSSSSGDVILPKDVLEIYEPDVLRYIFAGTRPNAEFAISFDLDVLQTYEDFDLSERVYFGKEKIENKKEETMHKRSYELACIKIPKEMPDQPTFRHLTMLTQVYEGDIEKAIEGYKGERVRKKAECAWRWATKYAPEDMKFTVKKEIDKNVVSSLSQKQKEAIKELVTRYSKKDYDNQTLFNEFYEICKKIDIKNTEFFEGVYLTLIGKKKGPKLATLILALEKKRVLDLLKKV